MQITIVQGAFLPVPPVAGGAVEKLWFELGCELARRGLDVQHISRAWPGLPRHGDVQGVRHRRLPGFQYPASGLLAKLMDLGYSLRCLMAIQRSDVIVTNTFFLPLLLSLLPRRGVVYVSVHRFPQGQMALYRRVDRLQCVSSVVADAVCRQAPSLRPKVKVVPNYVSAVCKPDDWAAGWPARPREILFVGRVHPEKGLDLLIAAYAAIAPELRQAWSLRIVGPHSVSAGGGGEEYLSALHRKAAELGVAVEWTGAVYDKAALDACYARARLFVYPTIAARGEAFPLAPLEAMAQGCAVITSDLPCFRDFIDPGRNADDFALGPEAALELRDKLQALMQDDQRQRSHALAAMETAERFSLRRVADAFVDDFHSLLAA